VSQKKNTIVNFCKLYYTHWQQVFTSAGENFSSVVPTDIAPSFSDGVATCYLLAVLWIMFLNVLRFHARSLCY